MRLHNLEQHCTMCAGEMRRVSVRGVCPTHQLISTPLHQHSELQLRLAPAELHGNALKLYLIRHAESENNAVLARNGAPEERVPDPELTDIGHRQAELLGEHLAHPEAEPRQLPGWDSDRRGYELTHLYCSLMTRSILTAQYIAGACGLNVTAHEDIYEYGGLFEHPGNGKTKFEGPGRDYFESRFPALDLPDTLGTSGWYGRPRESETEFLARTRRAVQDILETHGASNDVVALVVHGDFIDQFINELLGFARREQNYAGHWVSNWAMHNTSVTRIDLHAETRTVVYTNRIDHLPSKLVTW